MPRCKLIQSGCALRQPSMTHPSDPDSGFEAMGARSVCVNEDLPCHRSLFAPLVHRFAPSAPR